MNQRVLQLQHLGAELSVDEVGRNMSLAVTRGPGVTTTILLAPEHAAALGATLLRERVPAEQNAPWVQATIRLFDHDWQVSLSGKLVWVCGCCFGGTPDAPRFVTGDEEGNAYLYHDPYDGEQLRQVAAVALGSTKAFSAPMVTNTRWTRKHGLPIPQEIPPEVLERLASQVGTALQRLVGWTGESRVLYWRKAPPLVLRCILADVLDASRTREDMPELKLLLGPLVEELAQAFEGGL